MSYDEEETNEEPSFKVSGDADDLDDALLDEPLDMDFGLDEEDPDHDH